MFLAKTGIEPRATDNGFETHYNTPPTGPHALINRNYKEKAHTADSANHKPTPEN